MQEDEVSGASDDFLPRASAAPLGDRMNEARWDGWRVQQELAEI